MPEIKISGVAAVMLGVQDVAAAVAFYTQKLGLRVIMQESQIALLQCGPVMLGLNHGLAQKSPHTVGATEVVLRVDSLKAAHQALLADGISFESAPHQITPTDWVAHFRDLDGHLLSIFGLP
jgi:catechol 2,3-dioxygenase-like lactoylglutathione lyase family enzyme